MVLMSFRLQMIVEPELRVADFAKAGADIISIHAEQQSTIHLHRTVNQVGQGWVAPSIGHIERALMSELLTY